MTRSVGKLHLRRREEGFTLIELMVAFLVLAIVLAALLPAFYGSMRATASTNQRSVANGLAVTALEQIRSAPYYEVGYLSTPSACQNPNDSQNPDKTPVTLASGSTTPLSGTSTQTIGNTTYSVTRCLYWVDSSVSGDTLAYKQAVVTVSWTSNGIAGQITDTSALYPGGETTYQSGGQQSFAPGGTTATTAAAGDPYPPSAVSAVDDSISGSTVIDVGWTPPTSSPVPAADYIVEYVALPAGSTTATACPSQPFSTPTQLTPEPASASPLPVTLSPSTVYCFDVISVASDGSTKSVIPSPVAEAATSAATSPSCTLSNLVVNNSTTKVPVDSSGHLVNQSSIPLSVNASNCSSVSVSVGYTTNSSTVLQATMTGTSSILTGSAGSASTVWNVGNDPFTVYVTDSSGLHAYNSGAVQVYVQICQENGNSGKCNN